MSARDPAPPSGRRIDQALSSRAAAAGVATAYDDWAGRTIDVPAVAVERALAALGDPAQRPAVEVERTEDPGAEGYGAVRRPDGSVLVTAPPGVPSPTPPGQRLWGWQVQLYQLRSAGSWGIGDYADLATLATAFGEQGADLLLVNPLHAITPVPPVQRSPYYPSSRRFSSQVFLAVEALPEHAAADQQLRDRITALRPPTSPQIDHEAVWAAKSRAMELLVPPEVPPLPDRGEDDELRGFAVFCALAEQHGPDWHDWPAGLQRPGPAAHAAADPDRVRLHRWVQVRAREQLDAAQAASRAAGMRVGIVHDLAVGVDPGGADAWLLQDDLARGFTIGAPPDSFNQLGQDWRLPPFRPDRLAERAFAPFRQVVRASLAHGGGLRVDHVMGLFRLWWVPDGGSAADGTYVRYDSDALLAVVAAEAAAAGALVVGEDLGTVEPAVTAALRREGVLGSAVLWFEREEDDPEAPLPPGRWREAAAASISTHDLPTAYGFLAGEPARVRAELGQLAHSREEEERRLGAERDALLDLLRTEGLLPPLTTGAPERPDDRTVVLALHRMLTASPSRVVLLAPADAVGDLRQPNLPGTTEEYPNWRLPLADGDGQEVSLEAFLASPGTAELAALVSAELSAERL